MISVMLTNDWPSDFKRSCLTLFFVGYIIIKLLQYIYILIDEVLDGLMEKLLVVKGREAQIEYFRVGVVDDKVSKLGFQYTWGRK